MFQRRGAGMKHCFPNKYTKWFFILKKKTNNKKWKSKREWKPDGKRTTRVINQQHFAEYSVLSCKGKLS